MAYYSKKTKLTNLLIVSNGAGTLSKDSYVLTEVTKIVTHGGYSDVTFKHSLYGKSTKQRSINAELLGNDINNSISKTVTVTTAFTSLLTLTETVKCEDDISTKVSGALKYVDSSTFDRYGITTDPDIMSRSEVSFVTFGKVSSYPYSMKYGETETVTTDKSSDYRLDFYDTSGIKRYTVSFSGTSVDFTIPITVFQEAGGNLITMKFFEEAQGIDICEVDFPCSVSETACNIGIQAVRSSSDADPSLVTITLVGESAASSTSRTVTIYAKETSASSWTTIGTVSPATSSFTETFTTDLAIDYAWDIYATISDGYTSAESSKVRIYSKTYIMDVRTDGKGLAFGGTAANEDEMYCGFGTLRAEKITVGDCTTGDIAAGDITATSGTFSGNVSAKRLSSNSNVTAQSMELSSSTPFIGFHYGNGTSGYDTRIINDASGRLSVMGDLNVTGAILGSGGPLFGTTQLSQTYSINKTSSTKISFTASKPHYKANAVRRITTGSGRICVSGFDLDDSGALTVWLYNPTGSNFTDNNCTVEISWIYSG